MIEHVDLAAAQADTGLRLVVAAVVPNPWSEAAKGLLTIGKLPCKLVRHTGDVAAINAWMGTDNVPVLLHGREPARTAATAIVGHLARLAPGVLVPDEPVGRAKAMGLVDIVAGESGLGWNVRLAMIHAGLESEGKRGFPAKIAAYLAARYGYEPARVADLDTRLSAQLDLLRATLGDAPYFGGEQPNAIDVYVAAFLTVATPFTDADYPPAFSERLRPAFATAAERVGPLVPAALRAQRQRMFERWLPWPIAL